MMMPKLPPPTLSTEGLMVVDQNGPTLKLLQLPYGL